MDDEIDRVTCVGDKNSVKGSSRFLLCARNASHLQVHMVVLTGLQAVVVKLPELSTSIGQVAQLLLGWFYAPHPHDHVVPESNKNKHCVFDTLVRLRSSVLVDTWLQGDKASVSARKRRRTTAARQGCTIDCFHRPYVIFPIYLFAVSCVYEKMRPPPKRAQKFIESCNGPKAVSYTHLTLPTICSV